MVFCFDTMPLYLSTVSGPMQERYSIQEELRKTIPCASYGSLPRLPTAQISWLELPIAPTVVRLTGWRHICDLHCIHRHLVAEQKIRCGSQQQAGCSAAGLMAILRRSSGPQCLTFLKASLPFSCSSPKIACRGETLPTFPPSSDPFRFAGLASQIELARHAPYSIAWSFFCKV